MGEGAGLWRARPVQQDLCMPEPPTRGRVSAPQPSIVAIHPLAPLVALLGFGREGRDRARVEASQGNRLAGFLAEAVGAILDSLQRSIDLGNQLALTVAGAQLDRPVGLRRGAIGEVGVVLVLLLEMLKGLACLLQDVLSPRQQLGAEILPLTLVHEGFFVRRPVIFVFLPGHAPELRALRLSGIRVGIPVSRRAYIARARPGQLRNRS